MKQLDTPAETRRPGRRPPWWQVAITAMLVVWLGAQFVAGWKFANAQTYPIVGSAMFNGPPIPDSEDFLVPRVFGITSAGTRVEMDQETFGLEPFEWRRWIKRNLQDVTQQEADVAGAQLAEVYSAQSGQSLVALELWRIPARTDDFDRGRFLRSVEL